MLQQLINKLRDSSKPSRNSFMRNHVFTGRYHGGSPIFRKYVTDTSKYMPHQGVKECERRRRS